MTIFIIKQYVCKICGYNMIGYHPLKCPFCNSSSQNFISAEKCSKTYSIISKKVNENVFRLNSYPKLGYEHSAYCIKTNNQKIWIDCPSTFKDDLERMDKILFTHHHFLGASNLFRNYYTAFIWIHEKDSKNILAQKHSFDKKFNKDFKLAGIEGYHVDGHTSGFTIYIFKNILFICDYVFLSKKGLYFNPYGPIEATLSGASQINEIIKNKELNIVCGYNYIFNYSNWKERFDILLNANKI